MIGPNLFDDDQFVSLTRFEQMVWVYLNAGWEARSGCAGLLNISVGALSDALRASPTEVHHALGKLANIGWIIEDRRRRVIRIPNAPADRRGSMGNVPVGAFKRWFRKWQELPDCALKWDHLESLRAVAPSEKAWSATFGTVSECSHLGFSAEKEKQEDTAQLSLSVEFSEKPGNRRKSPDLSCPDQSGPDLTFPDACEPEEAPSTPEHPDRKADVARRLWDQQERLRADLELPPVPADDNRLTIVRELLREGWSEADLSHALRARWWAAKGSGSESARGILNGRSNWHPSFLEAARGMPTGPAAEAASGAGARASPGARRGAMRANNAQWDAYDAKDGS